MFVGGFEVSKPSLKQYVLIIGDFANQYLISILQVAVMSLSIWEITGVADDVSSCTSARQDNPLETNLDDCLDHRIYKFPFARTTDHFLEEPFSTL